MAHKIDWKTVWLLIGMFVVTLLIWHTPFMFFNKAFTVFWHEVGHGTGAVLTGGSIESITLSPELGGLCTYRGGWQTLILPAGYLGSFLFGSLIIIGAAKTNKDKYISMFLGVVMALITVFFVRSVFGWAVGLGFAAVLFLLGWKAPEKVNDIALKYLGLTSTMYAVIDIYDDLISRTIEGSDAYAMSELWFGPPIMWGVLWMLFAIVGSFFVLRTAVRVKQ